MKVYVITTGTVFGLVAVAHVWRMIEEGAGTARNPWLLLSTGLAAALGIWAWRLLRSLRS